jgi:hypothetical protein
LMGWLILKGRGGRTDLWRKWLSGRLMWGDGVLIPILLQEIYNHQS